MNFKAYIKCSIKRLIFDIGSFCRQHGFSKKYSSIQQFHNIHKGERCFILCTGPSLTREDILLLKNECTFGMNSICKLLPELNWQPTYYAIQDIHVFDKLKDSINSNTTTIQDRFVCSSIFSKRNLLGNWIQFPLNTAYHEYDSFYKQKFFAKFSNDVSIQVYDGFSITYSIIQIAAYMGFNTIYLIGADNGYSKTGKHHIVETGHVSNFADDATIRFNSAYLEAKRYADQNSIKIINVTRGGTLEIFPRMVLEDVLEK